MATGRMRTTSRSDFLTIVAITRTHATTYGRLAVIKITTSNMGNIMDTAMAGFEEGQKEAEDAGAKKDEAEKKGDAGKQA